VELRQLGAELLDEEGEVLAALPQGWDEQRDPLDSIEQIRSKAPGPNLFFEGALSGAQETQVDVEFSRTADAREAPVLESAQQLRLHAERHLPDLVEEQRAPICGFDLPHRALRSSGERPLLVTEQLAFE
jgi:hypothetical protein